jgi:hypothetical protein
MKKMVLTILAAALTTIVAAPASAEGGCPQGQIPAASNGSIQSCIPIPREQGLAVEPPRWHTRFGALAFDPVSGLVTGSNAKRTAADADEAAMRNCERGARGACKSLGTYSNGCIVAMRPKSLKLEPMVNFGASVSEAKAVPARFCADKGFECDMVYSGCSKASWF